MIVDVHTHVWDSPDQFGTAVARHIRRSAPTPWQHPDPGPQAFDVAMEPVTHAIVHGFESIALGANISIDQIARFVSRKPMKYMGFAGIDPLGARWRDKLKQAVDHGLVGVTICPAAAGFHPAHTQAMALYEQCAMRGLPVMVETDATIAPQAKLEFAQPHLFDEVAREFPTLPIMVSRVGYPWVDQTLTLIAKHDHVWADLTGLIEQPWLLYQTLVHAYQTGAIEHLVFGSRFPFCTPEHAISAIYSVNGVHKGTELPTIPREQLRAIVERDTLACLGIATPDAATQPSPATIEPAPLHEPEPEPGALTESAETDATESPTPVEPSAESATMSAIQSSGDPPSMDDETPRDADPTALADHADEDNTRPRDPHPAAAGEQGA